MSSNIRVKRICQYCNEEFIARTTVTKYCGDPCAKRAYKERKRKGKVEKSNKITRKLIIKPIEELKAKPFLSINETSFLLGISRRTIYRMMERGDLKFGKIGRRTIIRRVDIESLFKRPNATIKKSKPIEYKFTDCYQLIEIQAKYKISEKALYELIKRNNIPKIKRGQYVFVPKNMIDELLT